MYSLIFQSNLFQNTCQAYFYPRSLKILNYPKQLTSIPKNFYVNIPTELSEEIEENPDHIHEIGVKWCIKQCEELLNNGVMSIHYYIMSGAKAVTKVLKELNK